MPTNILDRRHDQPLMTPDEHRQIIKEEEAGTLLIGVDRPSARKFFTDVPRQTLAEKLEEPLYLEKAIVLSSFVLGYALIAASVALSVRAFGWWAFLVATVTLVVWASYLAESSKGATGIVSALLVVGAVLTVYALVDLSWATKLWLFTFAGSIFFSRFTYSASTFLLRALVIRNWRALDLLEGNGVVLRKVN